MLTAQTHFLHVFFGLKTCAQKFLGLLPSFFFNQDLWSWTAAILQDSMPSLLIHLLHIFRISRFFYDGCWFPSCNVVLSRRAKAMISLLSLCYHGCWLQLCNQWQLLIALPACAMFVDVLTRSHSSAGQSVRPITVRSAAQARVGPSCIIGMLVVC